MEAMLLNYREMQKS